MGAIFELKVHQNAFAVGASFGTPTGILQRSPRPSSWFSGASYHRRDIRKGEGKRERKGRKGNRAFSRFFSYNLTTADTTVIQVNTHLRRQVEDK